MKIFMAWVIQPIRVEPLKKMKPKSTIVYCGI